MKIKRLDSGRYLIEYGSMIEIANTLEDGIAMALEPQLDIE